MYKHFEGISVLNYSFKNYLQIALLHLEAKE